MIGAPATPTSADRFTLARKRLEEINKDYGALRKEWYDAQDRVRKASPVESIFGTLINELYVRTEAMIGLSERFVAMLSGYEPV